MPYKSEAQRRFFNSPAGKAKIGKEEVEHWNEASKGKNLPEKAVDKAIQVCDGFVVKRYKDHYALFLNGEKLEEGTHKEMEDDIKDYYFKVSYLPTGRYDNEGRKTITVIAANKKKAIEEARAKLGKLPKDLRIEK